METQRRGGPLKRVAASFGSSYDTFFRATKTGRIKVIRLGKRLFKKSCLAVMALAGRHERKLL